MPRRIAVAVGVALLLGACTAGPSETSRTGDPDAAGNRLELSAQPLWRGDADGLPEIMQGGFGSARFVDGLLLLEWAGDTTAVVDPDTGKPVWAADPELRVGTTAKDVELWHTVRGRAPMAQVAGETLLFADYNVGQRNPPEVAAVRLRDASPLWHVPDPYDVVDANDRLVVLADGDEPGARGRDATTGATRWDVPGVWPRFVAGDRVLAEVSSKAPDLDAEDSTVVGLDAVTGGQLWSLADRYTRSEVAFVAGDVALVYARPAGTDTERDVAVMVDVSSGAEITRLGWDWGARTTCATDGSTVIACTLDERLDKYPRESTRLITFDVKTRKSHPAKDHVEAEVRAVWGDYVFVRQHHVTWAVDRNGTRVSDDLPGDLVGMDDHHVMVIPPDAAPAMYAVR